MRLTVTQCDSLLTHDMGPVNEDGERYLIPCWDTVVRTEDGRQWVFPLAETTEEEGQAFADRVAAHGSIDPEKWTECTQPELPDYVTHYWRPEFN